MLNFHSMNVVLFLIKPVKKRWWCDDSGDIVVDLGGWSFEQYFPL